MSASMRGWLGLVGLALLGVSVIASPVPNGAPKAANMPAGRYILAGETESAQGRDVHEFMAAFRMKPGQYILSGGPTPNDPITVDDDLEVSQGTTKLFVDDDEIPSTERRGKSPAMYQGQPIVLVLGPAKPLQLRVTDHRGPDAIVGELWLHRFDGAKVQLTKGVSQQSVGPFPHTLFDEKFDLSKGFEMPKTLKHDATTELPDKPASLLARFKRK